MRLVYRLGIYPNVTLNDHKKWYILVRLSDRFFTPKFDSDNKSEKTK